MSAMNKIYQKRIISLESDIDDVFSLFCDYFEQSTFTTEKKGIQAIKYKFKHHISLVKEYSQQINECNEKLQN